MATRVTADDFFTGLLAGLALRARRTISVRDNRFDAAVEQCYRGLSETAGAKDLDIRFRIQRHRLHGDSTTVRDSISRAAQRDLISLDNPEYQDIRLKLSKDAAERLLEDLPVDRETAINLATTFIDAYEIGEVAEVV